MKIADCRWSEQQLQICLVHNPAVIGADDFQHKFRMHFGIQEVLFKNWKESTEAIAVNCKENCKDLQHKNIISSLVQQMSGASTAHCMWRTPQQYQTRKTPMPALRSAQKSHEVYESGYGDAESGSNELNELNELRRCNKCNIRKPQWETGNSMLRLSAGMLRSRPFQLRSAPNLDSKQPLPSPKMLSPLTRFAKYWVECAAPLETLLPQTKHFQTDSHNTNISKNQSIGERESKITANLRYI